MAAFKVVVINVSILAAILGFVNYGGALAWDTAKFFFQGVFFEDERASYPNYDDVDWAATHFDEFAKLRTTYEDFIGWRRDAFDGETVNINERGVRASSPGNLSEPKAVVWLFGGSTMWGTGVDDAHTIPSYLARKHGYKAVNYGESGYVSRQSLNQLMDELSRQPPPDFVVFYGGTNDVFNKCRGYADGFGTSREEQIRARMKLDPKTLLWQIQTPLALTTEVVGGGAGGFEHDCHENPEKARVAARTMIDNHIYAEEISERFGAQFLGILQPVSYFSDTKLDHMNLPERAGKQYRAVYPLFREYAREKSASLLDFVSKFDVDEYLYIDISHVSPRGNEIIADGIADELDQRLNGS